MHICVRVPERGSLLGIATAKKSVFFFFLSSLRAAPGHKVSDEACWRLGGRKARTCRQLPRRLLSKGLAVDVTLPRHRMSDGGAGREVEVVMV